MSRDDVKKVLHQNPKTASSSIDAHLQHLTNAINHTLQTNCFPNKLKQSEVIPVYKKLHPLEKENYRPVRLLPHVSKFLENHVQTDKFIPGG